MLVYYSYRDMQRDSPQLATTLAAPTKPEELVLLDDLLGLNMSFLPGGYVDQPWLLIQLVTAAAQAREIRRSIEPTDSGK